MKLYDVNSVSPMGEITAPIWAAKNVSHDNLHLRVPIWITDLKILGSKRESSPSKAHIICGTGYKHLRVYDTLESSRQPVISIDTG